MPPTRTATLDGAGRVIPGIAASCGKPDQIAAWARQVPPPGGIQREVLFLRACNELEEHLDLGLLYCGETKLARAASHDGIVAVTEGLGHRALAAELRAAIERTREEAAASRIDAALMNPTGAPSTSVILSASHRRRWTVGAVDLVRGIRRWTLPRRCT